MAAAIAPAQGHHNTDRAKTLRPHINDVEGATRRWAAHHSHLCAPAETRPKTAAAERQSEGDARCIDCVFGTDCRICQFVLFSGGKATTSPRQLNDWLFSTADVAKLHLERKHVAQKLMSLRDQLFAHKFKTQRGAEYAYQGFCRRVDEIDRTINFVFNVLPPEQEDIPDRDDRIAATILVQSFVINVQGCVRIWPSSALRLHRVAKRSKSCGDRRTG